tara:strand:- start:1001 stop:1480 length:480 start_codon:yes stop_codon:yes gene_type:complete
MPYKHEDRTLPMDVAFTLGDEQFPANWLRLSNTDDKATRGIVWEKPIERTFKDKRWYDNRVVDGEVISTPKDLDGLKKKMVTDAKKTAHNLLSVSDWMVIREADIDTPVAQDWAEHREAVRAESNRQEEQIAAAADVEALAAIVSNWPKNPLDESGGDK